MRSPLLQHRRLAREAYLSSSRLQAPPAAPSPTPTSAFRMLFCKNLWVGRLPSSVASERDTLADAVSFRGAGVLRDGLGAPVAPGRP